jgi:hypothetical protein
VKRATTTTSAAVPFVADGATAGPIGASGRPEVASGADGGKE